MSTFVPLDQGNKSDNYKNEHSLGECLTLTDSKSFLLPYCIGSVFMLIVNTAILIIIAIQIYLRISQKNKFLHSRSLYLYYLAALSCSMYQVFLFDTGFFEVFYIQVYFQNLYFLMLLFTFGYKSLKLIQATNCQKITLQTCQIIALLFYTTMLILNLVPLTDNMQNNLPCQSPFIQSIRIFEFILGLFFLSLWKTFSDRIQGEIEANKKFLNHDDYQQKQIWLLNCFYQLQIYILCVEIIQINKHVTTQKGMILNIIIGMLFFHCQKDVLLIFSLQLHKYTFIGHQLQKKANNKIQQRTKIKKMKDFSEVQNSIQPICQDKIKIKKVITIKIITTTCQIYIPVELLLILQHLKMNLRKIVIYLLDQMGEAMKCLLIQVVVIMYIIKFIELHLLILKLVVKIRKNLNTSEILQQKYNYSKFNIQKFQANYKIVKKLQFLLYYTFYFFIED